jgi:lipopolysaccharide export system protein LptC
VAIDNFSMSGNSKLPKDSERQKWPADIRRDVISPHRGYSQFVTWMKYGLPVIALGLIASVFLLPKFDLAKKVEIEWASIVFDDESLSMVNPRFLGSDIDNQQFVVTADKALQSSTGAKEVTLTNIQADITLNSGRWISIASPSGIFNPETNILDLTGEISIFSDSGDQLIANSATVDLAKKRINSDKPLQGHGPLGQLEADSMSADQMTGNLKFVGNVRLLIPARSRK